MNDVPQQDPQPRTTPSAVTRHSRWPGWIWAVPVAAALIVAWLGYQQLSSRGPSVTVTFPTGGGIKAGDTKVQYEGIEVGVVDSVKFEKDLRHVSAVLQLHSDIAGHLGKGTRFWIAGKPNISDLSSLRSVIAGPHIGIQPMPGPAQDHYDGLAERPPDAGETKITHYVLRSTTLGNLSAGSPIYFRDLQVGVVARSQLEADGRHFRIDAFINAPFDRLVHAGTRFWDAGAVALNMGGSGPRVQFQSVPALLEGAVDFETSESAQAGAIAEPDTTFTLYETRDAAEHAPDNGSVSYRVVFHAAQAGALDAGAPVTLEQKRIGTVTQSTLQYDATQDRLDDLVTLAIDPAQITLAGAHWGQDPRQQMDLLLRHLIGQGLRARLGSTVPVVGGKSVELAFVPHAAAGTLGPGPVPEIPTGPGSDVSGLMASLNSVAAKLNAMPIEQIGDNVHQITERLSALSKSPQLTDSLHRLNDAVGNLDAVTRDAHSQAAPLLSELRRAASEAQSTITAARNVISSNPLGASQPETAGLGNTLYELGRAARSLRELADYLDRHPEALLRGKGDAG